MEMGGRHGQFRPPDTVPGGLQGPSPACVQPQVTLMRTTAAENDRIGRWIGERLNRMDGPVRFFLPELGLSALDQKGQAFYDPQADAALFGPLEQTVRQTARRQLIRVKRHINDPEFSAAVVAAFRALQGQTGVRRLAARRQ
jgi:uncharacterized protein (UPF0261 family)